ncbi:MAG TPA: hypothetical protein PLA71_00745 [Saccharofermentans sp.]|nr:hypothetical protein [Saccharofermentans sp.]
MTFGKSRYDKKIEWEMIRFCTVNNFNIIGICSKLLTYFEKHYSPSSIISYCDKRWSTGKTYENCGFKYSGESSPNYWYNKKGVRRISRMQYQKHMLKDKLEEFDPTLTEWENMQKNGFDRIWDCGNKIFVKSFS